MRRTQNFLLESQPWLMMAELFQAATWKMPVMALLYVPNVA
jgi:hypothetical protein